jgi:Flp pilus assembly pilin Flp
MFKNRVKRVIGSFFKRVEPARELTMTYFLQDETGLELSEYAVAAALIAMACALAFTTLGGAIGDRINSLAATISA